MKGKRDSSDSSRDGAVLSLDGVRLYRDDTVILEDVTWRVEPGEHWAVIGPNGCGKTTMLKVATGGMWPSDGEVRALGHVYGEVNLIELRKRFGWVSAAVAEWMLPHDTARRVAVSGVFATYGLYDEPSSADYRRADDVLAFLGCASLAHRQYGLLSQGEKQKILIARALMADARLLILDEPAAGLDLRAREHLLAAIDKIASGPKAPTLILVTHHVEEIVPSITHVLAMARGRVVVAGPKSEVLTSETLSETFGLPVELDVRHGRFWARAAAPPATGE